MLFVKMPRGNCRLFCNVWLCTSRNTMQMFHSLLHSVCIMVMLNSNPNGIMKCKALSVMQYFAPYLNDS